MEVNAPEQVWVCDITYIKTEQGHTYLSLITDYYSKKIVGYHLADNLKTESSLIALKWLLNLGNIQTESLYIIPIEASNIAQMTTSKC